MRKSPLIWVHGKVRNRIPSILLLTAAEVGYSIFSVFFALGSRGVIDSAVAGIQKEFIVACVRQVAIIAAILICLTSARHLRERLRAVLDLDWKQQLLHGLLLGQYTQVSKYHSAELLNRLNNDVTKVDEGIISVLPGVASMLAKLVAAVVVLGTLDARFTGILLMLGISVIVLTGIMRRCLKELNKRVSEQDGRVSGFMQELMEKLLMVQAMNVSQEVESRAETLLQQRYLVQRKRKNVVVLANTGVSVMAYSAGFLALVWCAYKLLLGEMSFGSLTAVIQLVNQLQMPFVHLSGVLPQYVAMVSSAERLIELDSIPAEEVLMEEKPSALYEEMDSFCAENLCFSYDNEVILDSASFTLPKGAFAVIVGPSGVGKSTLLKLMLGIYSPESGCIYISGPDRQILLDRGTRSLFAYVPQGNMLLSGTLRENLTIVKSDATSLEIEQALYVSAMDEYIPGLPNGLDTVLGENGTGLSEGQAQRLAIARAVLSGAPVLLLDECTSALDEEIEWNVLTRLKALPNRTCIVVTHRPAATTLSNWNVEISEGKTHVANMNF